MNFSLASSLAIVVVMAPAATADLLHLFSGAKVPQDLQDQLVQAGVEDVSSFAAMFKDVDELHTVMKEAFSIDAKANIGARIKVAKLVVAWQTAKGRAEKMVEMQAEAEHRREPKHVPTVDHKAMKKIFQEQHGKLTDKTTPGQRFMEKRLDMIEKCEWKAERLSEVLAVTEDEETLGGYPGWMPKATLCQ